MINKKPKYGSLKPLVLPASFENKMDWVREFNRKAPLNVEVGFGLGEFLTRQCKENQKYNFIGIEHSWFPAWKTLRRIASEQIKNARVVYMDAHLAFISLFEPQSLCYVYALFPDPWFKSRHAKHRLFSHSFLRLVNNRLKKRKELRIVTDNEAYVDWICDQSKETGFKVYRSKIDPQFNTKYERKWHSKGQQRFYQLRFLKEKHIKGSFIKEKKMKTFRIDHFDADHFNPNNYSGNISVVFKDFVYDPKSCKGMVHVIVGEESITQQFWVLIVKTTKNWHIRVAKGSSAVPTAGVNHALDLIYEEAVKNNRLSIA